MPILLPRKENSSRSYIRDFLYPVLERFSAGKGTIRYRNCVLIFRHGYDRNRPERGYRDHDNIELNTVVDALAMFFWWMICLWSAGITTAVPREASNALKSTSSPEMNLKLGWLWKTASRI